MTLQEKMLDAFDTYCMLHRAVIEDRVQKGPTMYHSVAVDTFGFARGTRDKHVKISDDTRRRVAQRTFADVWEKINAL